MKECGLNQIKSACVHSNSCFPTTAEFKCFMFSMHVFCSCFLSGERRTLISVNKLVVLIKWSTTFYKILFFCCFERAGTSFCIHQRLPARHLFSIICVSPPKKNSTWLAINHSTLWIFMPFTVRRFTGHYLHWKITPAESLTISLIKRVSCSPARYWWYTRRYWSSDAGLYVSKSSQLFV